MMKEFIKRNTVKIRHKIARIIVPTVYESSIKYDLLASGTPRPMILFIKGNIGEMPLTGCELGVAEGFNALSILKELTIERLYLIDPYLPYVQSNKKLDYSSYEEISRKTLMDYEDRVTFIKKSSKDACWRFEDNSLNFVYIDANHEYEFVKEDIELWLPKVKSNGVIGGHDYDTVYQGVMKAVNERFNDRHIYNQLADWWIIKN